MPDEVEGRGGGGRAKGLTVKSSNHRVGRRAGDPDAPGGRVRDEDSGGTGEGHGEEESATSVLGEVSGQRLGSPVLEEDRGDDEDRDGEEVVVPDMKRRSGKGQFEGLGNKGQGRARVRQTSWSPSP
jgi:hypothetical protein